jgi:ribose transport system substrate-binding protein
MSFPLTADKNMSTPLRFVIVPKVAHPWFDEVHKGARQQAELLSARLAFPIVIDYLPPRSADTAEQNATLEHAAQSRPDGIAVDPVDAIGNMAAINHIRGLGIPLVMFDSPSSDPGITSVGNDFAQQGTIAAERLAALLGYAGKVAVMRGYPTAPNHQQRYEAQLKVLAKYPGIAVVDGGVDNDDIQTATAEATVVLEQHADLRGYLCCDASGPIGIAAAIKNAGKVGQVKVVGMDAIRPILEAIKEGIIESSAATIPTMQGAMSVLMLWQATLRMQLPQNINTGIDVITQENVDQYLAAAI